MFVFKNLAPHGYEVGFFEPTGEWYCVATLQSRIKAAMWVHYLNGGALEQLEIIFPEP